MRLSVIRAVPFSRVGDCDQSFLTVNLTAPVRGTATSTTAQRNHSIHSPNGSCSCRLPASESSLRAIPLLQPFWQPPRHFGLARLNIRIFTLQGSDPFESIKRPTLPTDQTASPTTICLFRRGRPSRPHCHSDTRCSQLASQGHKSEHGQRD
jgi:hypothetical protein